MACSKITRNYRFYQFGLPNVLRLEEQPMRTPGPGEVRISVQSIGLNRADLLWLSNNYLERAQLPSGMGYEISGIVDAVGPGVVSFIIGDRVSSIPAFSLRTYSSFGESAILPDRALIATPRVLSTAQASAFAFAYFTSYFALVELATVQPNQTILITAGTSATGRAAIALAKKLGASVIATTRSASKRSILEGVGVNHVIATQEEDLVACVNSFTGGRGVDVVFDCVVGGLAEKLAQSIRIRGRWIVYGFLDSRPTPFPWITVMLRAIQINIYKVFDFTGNSSMGLLTNEGAFTRAKQIISQWIDDGTLEVEICRNFSGIESLPAALEFMLSNQSAGKIVITL